MAIKFNISSLTNEQELVEISIPQDKSHILSSFLEKLRETRPDLDLSNCFYSQNLQHNIRECETVERNDVIFIFKQN